MSDTPESDGFFFKRGSWSDDTLAFCRKLERERDEAREELHKASVEANALATSIQKAEYSDAKEFELLGSVAGVISQIDNMYAGVRQQRDKARAALMKIEEIFVDGCDTFADRLAMGEIARAALEGAK